MAAFNAFNILTLDLCNGVHKIATVSDSGDQLAIALCAVAPVAANAVLSDLTPISYTNMTSSVNLLVFSSTQTTGTYKLCITDKVITVAGGALATFRYIAIYNDGTTVKTNPLIGWYDYGSNVTLAAGDTFTIDFDGSNGVFTIAPSA